VSDRHQVALSETQVAARRAALASGAQLRKMPAPVLNRATPVRELVPGRLFIDRYFLEVVSVNDTGVVTAKRLDGHPAEIVIGSTEAARLGVALQPGDKVEAALRWENDRSARGFDVGLLNAKGDRYRR
jgi:hypothetical protein